MRRRTFGIMGIAAVAGLVLTTVPMLSSWLGWLVGRPRPTWAADPARRPPDSAALAAATETMRRHEAALLRIDGVIGLGVGASDVVPGQAVIEVYVEKVTPDLRSAIPSALDGVPVTIIETGTVTPRSVSGSRG